MSELFQATVKGRTGIFTVLLSLSDGITGLTPAEVEIDGDVVLRWGRLDVAYGGGVLPSYGGLRLADATGAIHAAFDADNLLVQKELFRAEITGPDGFSWRGRVRRAPSRRPLARRVHKNIVEVSLHDGLGYLSSQPAPPMYPLANVRYCAARALLAAEADTPVAHVTDPVPANALDGSIRYVYYDEEPLLENGQFGTFLAQLEQVAGDFGAVAFRGTDGQWHFRHRAQIGLAAEVDLLVNVVIDGGLAGPNYFSVPLELAAQAVALSDDTLRGEPEDVTDVVPRVGTLTFTDEDSEITAQFGNGAGDLVELLAAPDFVAYGGGITFAPPSQWDSPFYATSHPTLDLYRRDDRFFQQGERLRVIDAQMWGLYGPQTRFYYDVDDDGAPEAFVAAGLELSLLAGTTRAVLVEVPESASEPALAAGALWFDFNDNSAYLGAL